MTADSKTPSSLGLLWLMASLSLAAIPHFLHQPLWLPALFLLAMGWRLLHQLSGWPLPAAHLGLKLVQLTLAGLSIALVLNHYGITIGRDAGVAILTAMLAFKVLEIRNLRDYYLSCFLGFFLVVTHFFFSQSMFVVALMLINVLLLTTCLITVNDSRSPATQRLSQASVMLVQAMPLMLLLFVLFPRIPGPLWGLANEGVEVVDTMPDGMTLGAMPERGRTGISAEMTIGRISQLIQSDAIAFRVRFADNQHPPRQDLYWRGPVLWHTDGRQWQPLNRQQKQAAEQPQLLVSGEPIDYTMTLERHNRRWLFALDFPVTLPESVRASLSVDGELTSNDTINRRSQFSLSSNPRYLLNPVTDPYLHYALQLPEQMHPQSRQLARELRQQHSDDWQYIEAILNYFSEQPFYYTLTPPLLEGDSVDAFLFESRQGFCEHYAASFTVLMRAAGIPARIVTGYQGGDINPVDQIMTVRQRDAHAWTEVWLPQQGWLRVDPTAAVASERVERGISDLLPAERQSPRAIANNQRLLELWQTARHNWEALNSAWDMWVVGYGPERQLQLLQKLGMDNPDWRKMAQWLVIGVLLVFVWVSWMTLRNSHRLDPVSKAYQRFCRQLAVQGVVRQPSEGPLAFARRAEAYLPEIATEIRAITDSYIRLRYRDEASAEAQFLQQVRAFRPAKSR